MITATGLIKLKEEKGSSVLTVNDVPIAKWFTEVSGNMITLSIFIHNDDGAKQRILHCIGHAEIFFFEGAQLFFSGTKYVNDFLIDEHDIIEELEKYEGEIVTIIVENVE